jgi:hypothetical protein
MKQPFGAKSAKSCLPSTHWIGANRKIEGAVSEAVAGKSCRSMDTATIERRGRTHLRDQRKNSAATAIEVNHGRRNWVRFVKLRGQHTFCRASTIPKFFVALLGRHTKRGRPRAPIARLSLQRTACAA